MHLTGQSRQIHFGVPGYLNLVRNFERFGFRTVEHSVDGDGVKLDYRYMKPGDIVYLMPEHHFPQCVTLNAERRALLERHSRERNIFIIEDDYDGEFYYDRRPMPALKADSSWSQIIYIGTFSKTLFNSLRLGYVVATPKFIRSFAGLHWALSRGTSGLTQRWVHELIEADVLNRHVQRMRSVYCRKRDAIAEFIAKEFPQWKFRILKGGLQFFIDTGDRRVVESFLALCKRRALNVAHPDQYCSHLNGENRVADTFLIIGFGASSLPSILSALAEIKADL
ncbi:putative transcriptional regulator of pyridoxine metabolism [Candidatus Burkholderia humilis]|nr:putative transcriptional regulator of pyridoxine metabolism [Candidatus Burkholderia humilis]